MKYFLIAGEASGDLHASNLMKALREKDTQANFVGLGGDKMRAEGCQIYVDYRNMAYMGFVAVLQNLGRIKHNFSLPYFTHKSSISKRNSLQNVFGTLSATRPKTSLP
jgi:lipid-A-disaccharide synthase